MPATAFAVELAVLHNFCWHELWTWRPRVTSIGRLSRLARFHLSAGAVSLAGNLLIAGAAGHLEGLGPIAANTVAVALMAVANYLLADRWVFPET